MLSNVNDAPLRAGGAGNVNLSSGVPREVRLSADYPMVAPSYAARRSEFAKQTGLGSKAAAEQPRRKRAKV
jgi:ROS/MUCR transcriptional regulator protein